MNNRLKKLFLQAAVIGCAATIFMLSSQEAVVSSKTSSGFITAVLHLVFGKNADAVFLQKTTAALHTAVRKAAHFCIYAALGFFTAQLAVQYNIKIKQAVLRAVLFCGAYAVTDELHQYFVPGRSCELRDVCIDTAGAFFGAAVAAALITITKKRKNKRGGMSK